MKRLLILFFVFSSVLVAQNKLNFDFDYGRFQYDSTSVYFELYYNINQNTIGHFVKSDSIYISAFINVVIINEEDNKEIINNSYQVVNSFPKADSVQNQNLIGKINYLLAKGRYKLTITVIDGYNTENKKSIDESVVIIPFNSNNFMISDIQLSSNIKQEGANKDSYFYKNSYEIIPNPVALYGENVPVLFYYNELYNVSDERYKNSLVLERLVVDSYGRIINKKVRGVNSNKNSIVEVGYLNLMKFPSGVYNLVLNLIDTSKSLGLTSSKKFYLVNKSVVDTVKISSKGMDLLSSEFGAMEIDEIEQMFGYCEYIATEQEKAQYKKVDSLSGKREFMFNFWKKRDPSPESPINEYKNDYFKRVEYARVKFTEFQKHGALTDRGRVYLIYGEPDEIDFRHNQIDTKPYQVWYYNSIEGGVEFIFADLSGYSQFELIHSTKRGELRDDNYMNRIKQAKDY
ncbi:MAG TPA: GWxTD domain-containing protein [Melioribacteraceae bacterium]|nr:GWxTD domain-containing protein [Melioribacteraceae bacterium]